MESCIFCKIAAGEIPSEKTTHEDGFIISFPDAHPVAPGHTLVIPAEHHRWFQDMPDLLSDKLFHASKKIALGLKEKTGADYIHLSIVGKDVPHVHVHLIPRRLGEKHEAV